MELDSSGTVDITSTMQALEVCLPLTILVGNLGGQFCCWYTILNHCGCLEYEQEQIRTQPPPQRPHNPFDAPTGVPKDTHLQPAYGV